MKSIAVAYLCRGADHQWQESTQKFIRSYRAFESGVPHHFYVIFKGFKNKVELEQAENFFSGINFTSVHLDDAGFDLGAYAKWARQINEDLICAFNSPSEILSEFWLAKLQGNLALPGVGLVGATGSFESIRALHKDFPPFPNFHIRSTAFLMDRRLFCSMTDGWQFLDKLETLRFENGSEGMTRKILKAGLKILIVGRNGRGYSPPWWPSSETFRQGLQSNLLVGDNQTSNFSMHRWATKRDVELKTWGEYLSLNITTEKINSNN